MAADYPYLVNFYGPLRRDSTVRAPLLEYRVRLLPCGPWVVPPAWQGVPAIWRSLLHAVEPAFSRPDQPPHVTRGGLSGRADCWANTQLTFPVRLIQTEQPPPAHHGVGAPAAAAQPPGFRPCMAYYSRAPFRERPDYILSPPAVTLADRLPLSR